MKIDFKDVTFIIPVRIDHDNRLENIEMIVRYLDYHFDTNIMIIENSPIAMLSQMDWIDMVDYKWQFNDSEILHRTKILNDMLENVKTKYVANYDTDVLFPVKSYEETLLALKMGEKIVFPYLGPFHEVNRKFVPGIKEKMEVDWIPLSECGINHPNSVGGAMFFETETYRKLGGECERFCGWGFEDNFRINLFAKFGFNVCRVGTVLYHLEHYRGSNSGPHHLHYQQNAQTYFDTINMSKEELINFINTYNRFKEKI